MARYRNKITRTHAAAELRGFYNDGYSEGITGSKPTDDSKLMRFNYWHELEAEQRRQGRVDGYAEFARRVRDVVKVEQDAG